MENGLPTHYFLVRQSHLDERGWIITVDSSWLDFSAASNRRNEIIELWKGFDEEFEPEHVTIHRGHEHHWAMWNMNRNLIIEIVKYEFGRIYTWDNIKQLGDVGN